jgi:hypothetical protein
VCVCSWVNFYVFLCGSGLHFKCHVVLVSCYQKKPFSDNCVQRGQWMMLCTTKKHPINVVFHPLQLLPLYHSSHQSSPPLELCYVLNTTVKEWQYINWVHCMRPCLSHMSWAWNPV